MNVEIIPAQQSHIRDILTCLRAREQEVYSADDAIAHLQRALDYCAEAWSGYIDGQIVCMWGIDRGSMLTNAAYVWLVTAQGINEHPFTFVRHSQIRLEELKRRYSFIHGVVQADNVQSVRWLRWLGFQLGDVEFVSGYALRKFSMVT